MRWLCLWSALATSMVATSETAQAQQAPVEALLQVVPADVELFVAADVAWLQQELVGIPPGVVGSPRQLFEQALDGVLTGRLGVTIELERLAWLLGNGGYGHALLLVGPVTGPVTAPAAHTYRGHDIYRLQGADRDHPLDLAVVTPEGIAVGDLGGVTAVIDALSGVADCLAQVPEVEENAASAMSGPGALMLVGAQSVGAELLGEVGVTVPLAWVRLRLSHEAVRLSLTPVEAAQQPVLRAELDALVTQMGEDFERMARMAPTRSSVGEGLMAATVAELGREIGSGLALTEVGPSVVVDLPVSPSLLGTALLAAAAML